MVNKPFVGAVTRIEEAIASILETAARTSDKEFIERIMKLAIKKEIVTEFLLDEIGETGETGTDCECSGTINATIQNTDILVNQTPNVGTVTAIGQLCPNCFFEGSNFKFTFTNNTPTPTNNSFTLVSTNIPSPTCFFFPGDTRSLQFTGLGVVTKADMSTVNVTYTLQLFESLTPGESDTFGFLINSQNFTATYFSPKLPDSNIVVEDC